MWIRGGGKFLSDNCPNAKIDGMDISETAIRRAKERYQDLYFFVGNLLEFSKVKNNYDAIILSEIMWYILQDIDEIVGNLSKTCNGKIIMINQTFYPDGVQKYGTEYFTDLGSMVDYLPWQTICKISIVRAENKKYESHSVYKI